MMNKNNHYTNPTKAKRTMKIGPVKEYKTLHHYKEPENTNLSHQIFCPLSIFAQLEIKIPKHKIKCLVEICLFEKEPSLVCYIAMLLPRIPSPI